MKHEINLNGKLNTNMIDEITNKKIKSNLNIYVSRYKENDDLYSTIYFKDLTDETNFKILKNKLKQELKKYILKTNNFLIIGIGNKNSNMDSLGPETLNHILVTKHLLKYNLDKKYKIVSKFVPDVETLTGIDTYKILKKIISIEKPNQIIIIDSLITNNLENITRCIQISNTGINLKYNSHLYEKSLTEKDLKVPVTLIGIPSILETDKSNIIITTKDIDMFIKKASFLIGKTLNEIIHSETNEVPE